LALDESGARDERGASSVFFVNFTAVFVSAERRTALV
jgi:hypothetical protein